MPGPTATQPTKGGFNLDVGRRRSMRVLLSVPVIFSGKAANNQTFTEETRTLVVNAHGALVTLAARVATGQTVMVSNRVTQESVECKVVYLGNAQGGKTQVGIEFAKPSPRFWRIDFPPEDWVVPED